MQLSNFNAETFMSTYWQKKPLFIKQAFPNFQSPISKEELLTFAKSKKIESRLVYQTNRKIWESDEGPFSQKMLDAAKTFTHTFLIQEVNAHHQATARLFQPFAFIPYWRMDDIMVSWATPNGGVGPHYDFYDVFLIQAEGIREWQITHKPVIDQPLLKSSSHLKLLKNFRADESFICEPGDVLYIPPGFGHLGTAKTECITISVGFRSISFVDFFLLYSSRIADVEQDEKRYSDPTRKLSLHPGKLDKRDSNDILNFVFNSLKNNPDEVVDIFSSYFSFGRRGTQPPIPKIKLTFTDIQKRLKANSKFERHGAAKLLYSLQNGYIRLYTPKKKFELPDFYEPFAALICDNFQFTGEQIIPLIFKDPNLMEVFQELLNSGLILHDLT